FSAAKRAELTSFAVPLYNPVPFVFPPEPFWLKSFPHRSSLSAPCGFIPSFTLRC
ncbi:MAG: hypothetical protein FD138_1982, partial [Planctomycetota bacterium]